MKLQKIVSCVLVACTLFSLTACGGKNKSSVNEDEMNALAPDYSAYTHKFDAYAYAGPNDGWWYRDDVQYYTGKDLRTVEGYTDYKDAGLNIYFPQTDARITKFNGGTVKYTEYDPAIWTQREAEWNKIKVYWDNAYAAGLDRIIMMEGQIQEWSGVANGMLIKPADVVIPEGEESPYTFQSEAEFDEAIAKVIQPYVNHPGFYGVMLKDEPGYACVEAYGQTYRAVKRVGQNVFNRDIFVQYNLFPMRASLTGGVYTILPLLEWYDDEPDSISQEDYWQWVSGNAPNQEEITPAEKVTEILTAELAAYGGNINDVASMKYARYLEDYILATGADYVQYDDYPLKGNKNNAVVLDTYMRTLQTAAEVAKKHNVSLQVVSQSFAAESVNGSVPCRILKENDCRWINNMLLAFGVSQINYYTYIAKKSNKASDLYYENFGSFVTRTGEKTDLYYAYQKINQENDKFAPTKLNFQYQGSRVYNILPANFVSTYCSDNMMDNSYQFVELKAFTVNKEAALVTESYDKENNRYMYCVQNLVDPVYKGSLAFQTTTLKFDSAKYKYVAIYRNGERTLQPLEADGKLTIKNAAGEAAFVIPY